MKQKKSHISISLEYAVSIKFSQAFLPDPPRPSVGQIVVQGTEKRTESRAILPVASKARPKLGPELGPTAFVFRSLLHQLQALWRTEIRWFNFQWVCLGPCEDFPTRERALDKNGTNVIIFYSPNGNETVWQSWLQDAEEHPSPSPPRPLIFHCQWYQSMTWMIMVGRSKDKPTVHMKKIQASLFARAYTCHWERLLFVRRDLLPDGDIS